MNNKKTKKGQTLLEVVLAIGIASIVIGAIAVLGMSTLKTSRSSLSRAEAGKLASSGVEAVRYVRDSESCGLAVFGNQPGCYIINTSSVKFCGVLVEDSSCAGEDYKISDEEVYNRKIEVLSYEGKPIDDIVLVRTTVTWNESSGTTKEKSVVLSNVLTNLE